MKKFLFFASAFITLAGFSQTSLMVINYATSVTIPANGTVNCVTTASANTNITLDVKNTSASTKSYFARRYDMVLHAAGNSTASAYFCFAGSCFGAMTTTSPNLTLTAGQSASQVSGMYNMLKADLDEANTAGYSEVRYSFINAATPADSIQITLRYNAPTGLNELGNAVTSLDLYPNPVTTDMITLKINSVRNSDGKISVYNALGSAVIEKTISLSEGKNKIELGTEGLSPGIYFSSIKVGGSTTTKKFVVK